MKNKIAVIGLGYVGLPLSVEFGKFFFTIGYDIDIKRISQLNSGVDLTKEMTSDQISSSKFLKFTDNRKDIELCNIYIITVPTPIDHNKSPNLEPIFKACELVGKMLKKDDIVIFESTVYPGCTEDDCVPILEKYSNMKYNVDFFCGYSPERINPGDRINTLTNIKKVTSGSNEITAKFVNELYLHIIKAGTYLAPSIKVAEASKAIENAQRDLNISFMNELALIFDRMDLDTNEVIEAASSKWNFLKYKPGLVGGHCIGVDPYYLIYKSRQLGYQPNIIKSGRKVNDYIPTHICKKLIELLKLNGYEPKSKKILILGFSFKENCPDIRNSKVLDIYNYLTKKGLNIDVYDPVIELNQDIKSKIHFVNEIKSLAKYDAILLCVAHNVFLDIDFKQYKKLPRKILIDIKGVLDKEISDYRL